MRYFARSALPTRKYAEPLPPARDDYDWHYFGTITMDGRGVRLLGALALPESAMDRTCANSSCRIGSIRALQARAKSGSLPGTIYCNGKSCPYVLNASEVRLGIIT